jgi:shikimate dehydrogenase
MITKDTQLCISIAARPSNFGTTLHNLAYQALDIDFIYKAISVNNLAGAMAGVRALGIRGCSVSMPFKETVIPYLDELDDTAQITGAVNSIVNDGVRLIGYNTDLAGARSVLATMCLKPEDNVLVLGTGGVARAILIALNQLGFTRVMVSGRSAEKMGVLNKIIPYKLLSWDLREQHPPKLLINATSIGMSPLKEEMPVTANFIREVDAVMDVVAMPMETRLISNARDFDKVVTPGYLLSLEQAVAQFKLYTGVDAPRAMLEKEVLRLLS